MKLTILGSGTGFPSASRGGPGHLVQSGDRYLVMDLGMGTLSKLAQLDISLAQIGPILISHLHPDHTAELVSLLFALKNLNIKRSKRLQLFGCRGFIHLMEKLEGIYGDWIRPTEFDLQIQEMEKDEVFLEDFQIISIPVEHTESSVGFRLTDSSGKILAYSGDTDYCPALVELTKNADLAIMDCSFPDHKKCPGHMTPSEVGKIAQKSGCKRVVLTHFYPECDGEDLVGQCRDYFSGEVSEAQDLIHIQL